MDVSGIRMGQKENVKLPVAVHAWLKNVCASLVPRRSLLAHTTWREIS